MNRLLPRLLKRALPLLPVVGHGISAASEPAAHPNIVYFLVDDMGYADCTFNGGTDIKTPNIDRLAAAGTILKSFYVQPLCSPTRSALLTGCYPTRTGVYHVITPGAPWGMPLDHLTIADVLKKAGYFTAICGKWHLGEFRREYRPNWRGFDHQYGHMLGNLDYFTHLRNGKLDWYRNDQPLHEEGYTTELIAREACRVIREHSQSHKPLFLYVPFNAIHSPYQVPEHYLKGYEHLTGRRKILAGMMAAADVAIGRICAELERQGMRKNTLIIFSSDNGGTHPGKVSLNTPLRGGKGSVYEGGVRVPAFVTWPGKIPAGKVIDEPLHIVDWFPTLAKLTGIQLKLNYPIDGHDIWPVLTQGKPTPHDAILIQGVRPEIRALRMGDWKLIVSPNRKVELYNLKEDIAETHNLAEKFPERVRQLRNRLDEMTRNAVPPGGPPPSFKKKKRATGTR